ncbi:hypothetical protein [Enterovirga sp. CN4-39]
MSDNDYVQVDLNIFQTGRLFRPVLEDAGGDFYPLPPLGQGFPESPEA